MPNLVLSRRAGEKIKIGESITVTVIEIRKGVAVRLSIQAPAEVRVDREEIWEKRKRKEEPQ